MASLQQVQDILERMLGTAPIPFHDTFWRGKTRDELVATKLADLPLFVPGKPENSYLIMALQYTSIGGQSGPRDEASTLILDYFRQVRAEANDMDVLEEWIREGCPEVGGNTTLRYHHPSTFSAALDTPASDDRHNEFWRAVDVFFLPGLSSPITYPHVNRLRFPAYIAWAPSIINAGNWLSYLAQPDVVESFTYVRHHQRRLIREYYGDSQSDLFDSLWKFGGNLLPIDPLSKVLPNHTMNGVLDWFYWVPYIDASLRARDVEAIDYDLARGWQIGIVADGLLRTDADRQPGSNMPISDFSATDPELLTNVVAKYIEADAATLITEMVRRARDLPIPIPEPPALLAKDSSDVEDNSQPS